MARVVWVPIEAGAGAADEAVVPSARVRYLADIADTVRGYHAETVAQAGLARRRQQLTAAAGEVGAEGMDTSPLDGLIDRVSGELSPSTSQLLESWPRHRGRLPGRSVRRVGPRS